MIQAAAASCSLTEIDLRSNRISISGLQVLSAVMTANRVRWLPSVPTKKSDGPPRAVPCDRWLNLLCHVTPSSDRRASSEALLVDVRQNATLEQARYFDCADEVFCNG